MFRDLHVCQHITGMVCTLFFGQIDAVFCYSCSALCRLFKPQFVYVWKRRRSHTVLNSNPLLGAHGAQVRPAQYNRIVKTAAKDWRGQTIIRFVYAHTMSWAYTHMWNTGHAASSGFWFFQRTSPSLYCCSFFFIHCCCWFFSYLLHSFLRSSSFDQFTCSHYETLCNRFLPVSQFMFQYPISHGCLCLCWNRQTTDFFFVVFPVCKHSVLVFV